MKTIDADALMSKYVGALRAVYKRYGIHSSEAGMLSEVMKFLADQPSVESEQRWISCNERLPEIGTEAILLYDSGEISGGIYVGNRTWDCDFASKNKFVKVNGWIPKPYGGKDEETNLS